MTLFVIVAGLLLVAVLAAILYPLLRHAGQDAGAVSAKARELNLAVLREQRAELEREKAEGSLDEAAYQQARQELERRALEDVVEAPAPVAGTAMGRPVLAGIVGLLVPAVAISLYFLLGQPEALTGGKPAASGEAGAHALSPEQIANMVERLAERLQENPNDGQGWLMLARSYGVLGRYTESAVAYARATSLLPPDGQTLADFADTVAMAQGRRLQGEPEKIVRRALEVDPKNVKALALSGTIAFDRQDYQAAIGEWRKVLAVVPEDSNVAAGIQGSIRDAENRMAVAAVKTGADAGSPADQPTAQLAGVSGTVTLDRSLAAAAAPGDTLFVFARAVDGPKIPLAMMRKTVADLPLNFSLDDSMAMAPNFRLSQYKQVVIGARISKSGDAMARPGDLEGLSAPVSSNAAGVKILIGTKVK